MKSKIVRVARKEFLDMFRDRRSLIRMMLIPLIAFPIIINLIMNIQSSMSEKEANKELTIGYIDNGQGGFLLSRLDTAKNYTLKAYKDSVLMRQDVINETINLGFILKNNFNKTFNDNQTAEMNIIYRGVDAEEKDRFDDLMEEIDQQLVSERLEQQDISTEIVKSFDYSRSELTGNVSDPSEIIGKYGGGILPYIFIAFCFMGCMYPAIDLFAGEKERGTLETLLIAPINRVHILIGKMIVITAFGLLSASLALIGLIISLKMIDAGSDFMELINEILTPKLFITLYVLLIPLTIFFTGVMTPISIYARSYKEAQSMLVPLNIVMVLPAIAGFIPSVELDYITAFIPIVNVVLATKQIIGGNMDFVLIGITFISLVLIAAASLIVSYRQFGRENNVLRGS